MNEAERRQRIALRWALDPALMLSEVASMSLDPWQVTALDYAGPRLILNCCRQSGKSTVAASKGLHQALFIPDSLVLLVSPSLRQSGELMLKVRDLLDWLPGWVKPELEEDNKLSIRLANKSRIVALPGTEQRIRGFSGVDLVILDEASRVMSELYYAVRPMLAVSGGQLIMASTPWGKLGVFADTWHEENSSWKKIEINAYDCPRITDEFLAEAKASMPEVFYLQEYHCQFSDRVSQVFSFEEIMGAISADVVPLFGSVAESTNGESEEEALLPLFSGGDDEQTS
ncbi:MAG: terminase large subunit domain-containing protein [Anaerolineales bacterium]